MAETVGAKRCTGPCGRALPVEEFHRDRSAPGGRRPRCRECVAGYHRANLERGAEQTAKWRAANPDHDRTFHAENRERRNEQRRARREANPHQEWESGYRKRCRALGREPVVESFTREELVAYWGNGWNCIYCDSPANELEHLRPVSLGGHHRLENCAPVDRRCNQTGGNHVRVHILEREQIERTMRVDILAAQTWIDMGYSVAA